MTVIFGLLGMNGRPFDASSVRHMSECFAPYGDERVWVGDAGALRGAYSVPGRSIIDGRSPRTSANGARPRGHPLGANGPTWRGTSVCGSRTRTRSFLLPHTGLGVNDSPRESVEPSRLRSSTSAEAGSCSSVTTLGAVPSRCTKAETWWPSLSTALALTGAPDVGHELDEERAVEVLVYAYATGRTFVRNVQMVPPGSAIWIDGSGISRRRWWEGRFSIRDAGSIAAHAEAMREELDHAVASALAGTDSPGSAPQRRTRFLLHCRHRSSSAIARRAADLHSCPEADLGGSGSSRLADVRAAAEVALLASRYENLHPSFRLAAATVTVLGRSVVGTRVSAIPKSVRHQVGDRLPQRRGG